MLTHGNLQLDCQDGTLTVFKEVLKLVSPTVLGGALEALGNSGSGEGGSKLPALKVDGTVGQWKLVLFYIYPVLDCGVPSREDLHSILPIAHKYDMTNLLAFIHTQLVRTLYGKMTLQPGTSTYVFKWLVTAEQLQLDDLRDECLDALGTYLLPEFHKHIDANMAALGKLSPTTMAEVMRATARCSSCVVNGGLCPGAGGARGSHCVLPQSTHDKEWDMSKPLCNNCTWKFSKTWHPATVDLQTCNGCKRPRAWPKAPGAA